MRSQLGGVVISTKLFTHSAPKERRSSPAAPATSRHRRKNRSARSQSAPVQSTRKNSCSRPILRTGTPLPTSADIAEPGRSPDGRRSASVEPPISSVCASILGLGLSPSYRQLGPGRVIEYGLDAKEFWRHRGLDGTTMGPTLPRRPVIE